MIIKLTKLQADILRHRLEVPDAISGCMCDGWDQPEPYDGWHPDDVEDCCKAICEAITDVEFQDFNIVRKYGSEMVAEILADCIDGSTIVGCDISDIGENTTELSVANLIRSGNALAAKVSEYIGRKVEFPTR